MADIVKKLVSNTGDNIIIPQSSVQNLETTIAGKQNTLTAGTGITIDNNVISATNAGTVTDVKVDNTSVVTSGVANIDLTGKQDTLTAGEGIAINNNVISSTVTSDVTDVKVNNTSVVTNKVANIDLTGKQDVLTAGEGIAINNNVISSTVTSDVTDVKVNGTSVVDSNKVANVNAITEVKLDNNTITPTSGSVNIAIDADTLVHISDQSASAATPAVDADTLDGHDSNYFSVKSESVLNVPQTMSAAAQAQARANLGIVDNVQTITTGVTTLNGAQGNITVDGANLPVGSASATVGSIKEALNELSEQKAVQTAVANAWAASTEYAVGDYVMYSGTMYKCITSNNDATFTISKWNVVNVTNETNDKIDSLSSAIGDTHNAVCDVNSVTLTDFKSEGTVLQLYLNNNTHYLASEGKNRVLSVPAQLNTDYVIFRDIKTSVFEVGFGSEPAANARPFTNEIVDNDGTTIKFNTGNNPYFYIWYANFYTDDQSQETAIFNALHVYANTDYDRSRLDALYDVSDNIQNPTVLTWHPNERYTNAGAVEPNNAYSRTEYIPIEKMLCFDYEDFAQSYQYTYISFKYKGQYLGRYAGDTSKYYNPSNVEVSKFTLYDEYALNVANTIIDYNTIKIRTLNSAINLDRGYSNIRVLATDGSGDFTSFETAVSTCNLLDNCLLVIMPGDYTITPRSNVGNHVHFDIFGYEGARLICNYDGANNTVRAMFSPIFVGHTDNERVKIEGITIECTNVQYCLHNESNGRYKNYEYIIKNCKFIHKSAPDSVVAYPRCIGGGVGSFGRNIIEDCEFKSEITDSVNYHSGSDPQSGSCKIIIKNCIAKDNTFTCSGYGSTTYKNDCIITGCLLGAIPYKDNNVDNMNLTEYLNEIVS